MRQLKWESRCRLVHFTSHVQERHTRKENTQKLPYRCRSEDSLNRYFFSPAQFAQTIQEQDTTSKF